jgi:hypothetical protein
MPRDLVLRAMAHDQEAFTELALLAIDKLYAIARLILRSPEQAEDAVQEALTSAWRDIAALRDPDRFEVCLVAGPRAPCPRARRRPSRACGDADALLRRRASGPWSSVWTSPIPRSLVHGEKLRHLGDRETGYRRTTYPPLRRDNRHCG